MSSKVEYKNPAGLPPAQGLYSHVGVAHSGKLHMIAGQLAVGAQGEVVGVNHFAEQFACVFGNLAGSLKAVGGDCNSIIKMTTYILHEDYIPEFMRLRADLFPKLFASDVYPPNTLLIVRRLVKPEFLLEVEATASI